MKLKQLFMLLVVGMTNYTCTNSDKNESPDLNNKANRYREDEKNAYAFLSERKYTHFIDTAKWYLYNYYCDIKINYLLDSDSFYVKIPKEKRGQYLSSLDLRIDESHIDTLNANLFIGTLFFINDSTPLIGNLGNNHGDIPDGIVISLKNKSFAGFASENAIFTKTRSDGKAFEPFTPTVKNFIDSNLAILNPKYLDLLKAMRVLR
jgi:hypothetical protein